MSLLVFLSAAREENGEEKQCSIIPVIQPKVVLSLVISKTGENNQ